MKQKTALLLACALVLTGLFGCDLMQDPAPPASSSSSEAASLPALVPEEPAEEEPPTDEPEEPEEDADALTLLLYERNRRSFQTTAESVPPELPNSFIPNYADELEEMSDEEIRARVTLDDYYIYEVTADEARADIYEAFRMLRLSYGGYGYYGGPEVFDAAEAAAIAALEATGSYYVHPHTLEAILIDSLHFIDDRHFNINGTDLQPLAAMYYAEGIYLLEEDGALTVELDGEVWTVDDAQSAALQAYLQTTIGPDGALCLGLFTMETEGDGQAEARPASLSLTSGGESRELPLYWVAAATGMFEEGTHFIEAETIDGIVVCRIHGMEPNTDEDVRKVDARLEKMGTACALEPVFLVDLRGNRGGYISYSDIWFEAYGSGVPRFAETQAQKFSPLAMAAMDWDTEELAFLYTYILGVGDWMTMEIPPSYVRDDRITFVLTDRDTASAAETMSMQFGAMENSLLVGSPTLGCSLVGNCGYHFLPNSNLCLYFGSSLFLAELAEGVGVQPDIWIDPALAEEAVFQLIEYYGL